MNTISTLMFHWDKEDKCFSQESSSLPDCFNPLTNIGPDKGFQMVSHRTKKEVTFIFGGVDRTFDGEIAGWKFGVDAGEVRSNPKLRGLTCLIIND